MTQNPPIRSVCAPAPSVCSAVSRSGGTERASPANTQMSS